jgi:putative ABC transport system permease protein
MWRNYLLVTWRSIKKHKGFTAINVIGLSLSMSVCLLLILLVHDHMTHDNFHPVGDRTYRVISYKKGERGFFANGYATSPLPIAQQFAEQYEMAENYTNLNFGLEGELESKYKIIDTGDLVGIRSLFADEHFFEIFGFEMLAGDEKTALVRPYTMVLSESMANLLFPKGDYMNAIVDVKDKGSYTVTGVIKEPEGKSHIKFNVLASFSTLPLLLNEEQISKEYDDWETVWMNYNYIVLKKGASVADAQIAINKIADANTKLPDDEIGYEYELQAITDIVPSRLLSNEIGTSLPRFVLGFFGFLAVILIITASINYTNLSIAKSLTRVKEIGIRKSNGATRSQIFTQFILESLLISMLSLIFAIFIYRFLIDQFNSIEIFSLIGLKLEDTVYAYGFFFLFSTILGVVCGAGPALYISKWDIVRSLKGSLSDFGATKTSFFAKLVSKRALLSIQFGMSIFLLITIFLLQSQADYLTKESFGFEDENTYFIDLQGHDPKIIEQEFSQIPGFQNITFASHHPAVGKSYGVDIRRDTVVEPIGISYFYVDPGYVEVMGLELLAGNDFPKGVTGKKEKFVLLNERALSIIGFTTPSEAINQIVTLEDSIRVTVVGVLKDYHWEPLMKSISPLVLRIKEDAYKHAYFQVNAANHSELHKVFEREWNELDPNRTFKGGFLNEETDLFYQFLYDLGSILTLISVIAIAITGLGFLGMVSFHMQTRTKEIGIRKVLGASFGAMVFAMSKGFLKMLAITSVISIPLAIVINTLWINQMAVHDTIGIWNVGPAILILVVIVAATLISQVWKSTVSNPVDSLRSE